MSARLAVLGLLVEQPLHGYGVESLIEARGMRRWTTIGFSSIYQLLAGLVADGLAEVQIEPAPGRGKERRVHVVTPKGRRVWEVQTLQALATVGDDDVGYLTALSGLPLLGAAAVETALRTRLAALEVGIARLDADRAAVEPVPAFVSAMFAHTRGRLEASRDTLLTLLDDLPASTDTTRTRKVHA